MSATMSETKVESASLTTSDATLKPTIEAVEAPASYSLHDVTANITVEEQHKLQQAWTHLFRLCDKDIDDSTPNLTGILRQHLSSQSPESFRRELWTAALPDHPDAAVLRFLRARKWDVQKSMEMLVSAINWRAEQNINDAIIRKGEDVAFFDNPTADEKAFIAQYHSGKSFVRGTDKEGRPIYVIKVRLHDPRAQTPQAMETYVLHNIESIKTMLTSPNDKACLIFDMTGFGLKNMDFHVVKFLVQVFEARYPETLGVILIHNAPFVFWGIWNVIKGWLDPVIAAKINFTSKPADMLRFIAKENLQSCYSGEDDFEYRYYEPVAGENDAMKQVENRAEIEAVREVLLRQFEQETVEWIATEAGSQQSKDRLAKRHELAGKLRDNFWTLDPYVRARSYYHRAGVVGPRGEVDFKAASG